MIYKNDNPPGQNIVGVVQGWSVFAKQIIEELAKYDRENNTDYAYYLTDLDDRTANVQAVKIIAEIMSTVDKKNQWEPVKPGKVVD